MRVIAYVPKVPRARQYRREVISKCRAEGVDLGRVTWTTDPTVARAMRDDGTACHLAVARLDHFREVYPEVLVAEPPRHRPGGVVAAGLLAGIAVATRRLWEHKVVTAATVAMVGAMATWPLPNAGLPPPVAAPPPLEDYAGLPPAEPGPPPEVEPPAQAVPAQPLPPAAEVPEMEPVAVEQPALPELPAVPPPPQATPPAPTPAPEPTPEPIVPPVVVEPPPRTPLLLCADIGLLGLIHLELCI